MPKPFLSKRRRESVQGSEQRPLDFSVRTRIYLIAGLATLLLMLLGAAYSYVVLAERISDSERRLDKIEGDIATRNELVLKFVKVDADGQMLRIEPVDKSQVITWVKLSYADGETFNTINPSNVDELYDDVKKYVGKLEPGCSGSQHSYNIYTDIWYFFGIEVLYVSQGKEHHAYAIYKTDAHMYSPEYNSRLDLASIGYQQSYENEDQLSAGVIHWNKVELESYNMTLGCLREERGRDGKLQLWQPVTPQPPT